MQRGRLSLKTLLIVTLVVIGIAALIGVGLTVHARRAGKEAAEKNDIADSARVAVTDSVNAKALPANNTAVAEQKTGTPDGKAANDAAHPATKPAGKSAGHGWTVSGEDSAYSVYEHTSGTKALEPGAGYFIRISKGKRQLTLFKDGAPVKIYPVGVGKNSVDKVRKEDNATPEGNFKIQSINNSKDWKFDGARAYGPWFLRLDTSSGAFSGKSWTGIGIHGTSNEKSIGGFVSHGCIRMFNNDITELKETIEEQVKTSEVKVVVLP